jgi:O-antigen ligase/tetratricopeptide (TPR) repeat protein
VVTLIGVVLAVVPFYATRYVFAGLMFEKAVLFYGLMTVLILAYLWLICLDLQYLPKFNLVGWAFLVLMASWIISTITSVQPYSSFWGVFNRMEGLISWGYYFALFVVMVGVLRKSEDWWRVIKFAMIGMGLVIMYGLGQLLGVRVFAMAGERLRVESTLGNPVFLGGYLASALPLALVWVFSLSSLKWRRWGWVFWGLACLTLLFTLSRGSWIAGLIAVPLTLTLYCYRYRPGWLKKILIFFAIGAAVSALLTTGWILSPKESWFRKTGELMVFRSESMIYRQRSWSAGIKAFTQKPLTGWGLENFHVAFDRNYQALDRNAVFTESHVDRAHNEYIGVAAAGGLVALIPYLLMLLYALYRGWLYARSRHDLSDYLLNLGMLGALVGYAIFVFTAFNLVTNILFLIFALAWMNRVGNQHQRAPVSWYRLVVLVLGLATLAAAYFTVVIPIWAVRLADLGTLEFQRNSGYSRSLKLFQLAIAKRSFMTNVIRSQMSVLASSGPALAVDGNKSLTEFQRYTGDILRQNFATEPYNSYSYMITGIFYGNLAPKFPDYIAIADQIFQETAELTPNKGETWLRWGQMYGALGDWPQAKAKLDKAMQVDPYNQDIMFTAGVEYIWFGESQRGDELIKQSIAAGHPATFSEIKQIGDALVRSGRLDKAETLYKQIVDDPQNDQETVYAITELVDVYRRAGRWQDALTTAEELRKYEVDKAEFDQLVSDIKNRVTPNHL